MLLLSSSSSSSGFLQKSVVFLTILHSKYTTISKQTSPVDDGPDPHHPGQSLVPVHDLARAGALNSAVGAAVANLAQATQGLLLTLLWATLSLHGIRSEHNQNVGRISITQEYFLLTVGCVESEQFVESLPDTASAPAIEHFL